MNKKDNYNDIINLPHHTSTRHPRMTIASRAAQFAPFAALTGYKEEVNETARITEKRKEITEEEKNILNNKLQIIKENIKEKPEISITYFIQDKTKTGGKYVTITGIVKKINMPYIILLDKTKISINEIIALEINK